MADMYTKQRRDHTSRARAATDFDGPMELQRTGSLPRSPNTRSLYQRSRGAIDSVAVKPSPLTKAAVASRTNRIPRKPPATDVFSDGNEENITPLDMEVDLLRKQSLQDKQKVSAEYIPRLQLHRAEPCHQYVEDTGALRKEVDTLRKALQNSESQLKATKEKLAHHNEDRDAEMNAFMNASDNYLMMW